MSEKFNDEMIRRQVWKRESGPLPKDAFDLIHDLAYHQENRNIGSYIKRAQEILKRGSDER